MPEEAKIRVRLDTDEAQQEVKKMDSGLQSATRTAGQFASVATRGVQAIAALAAGVATAGAERVGVFGALGRTAGALGASAIRGASSDTSRAVRDIGALDFAEQQTKQALGLAAASIPESELKRIFLTFERLGSQQIKGEQRIESLADARLTQRVGLSAELNVSEATEAFNNGVSKFEDAVNRLLESVGIR